jgi:hypothetical protein
MPNRGCAIRQSLSGLQDKRHYVIHALPAFNDQVAGFFFSDFGRAFFRQHQQAFLYLTGGKST